MEHTEDYVKLENVSKIYGSKEVKIIAVDEISFRIKKGEFVVVVGPSGAGKIRPHPAMSGSMEKILQNIQTGS